MDRKELEAELHRDPFIPLRLHLVDGRKFDVPFHHVVVFGAHDFVLLKGVKREGSRVATGFEVIQYERIDRVVQRGGGSGHRKKRAS
jgi:hypothetical protein